MRDPSGIVGLEQVVWHFPRLLARCLDRQGSVGEILAALFLTAQTGKPHDARTAEGNGRGHDTTSNKTQPAYR